MLSAFQTSWSTKLVPRGFLGVKRVSDYIPYHDASQPQGGNSPNEGDKRHGKTKEAELLRPQVSRHQTPTSRPTPIRSILSLNSHPVLDTTLTRFGRCSILARSNPGSSLNQ
jgi:hypothetical protein